jgi:hypothetical protein
VDGFIARQKLRELFSERGRKALVTASVRVLFLLRRCGCFVSSDTDEEENDGVAADVLLENGSNSKIKNHANKTQTAPTHKLTSAATLSPFHMLLAWINQNCSSPFTVYLHKPPSWVV